LTWKLFSICYNQNQRKNERIEKDKYFKHQINLSNGTFENDLKLNREKSIDERIIWLKILLTSRRIKNQKPTKKIFFDFE
jgi:hypothetical protein